MNNENSKPEAIYYCEQGDPYCMSPNCKCNTVRPKQENNIISNANDFTNAVWETKKETLEEAAERLNPVIIRKTPFGSKYEWIPKKERKAFINGAKWQQEQRSHTIAEINSSREGYLKAKKEYEEKQAKLYTEEEVQEKIFIFLANHHNLKLTFEEWIEQFKK